MNQKMIIFSCLMLSFSWLEAKESDATVIGHFPVSKAKFAKNPKKKFINDLPYDVVLRYKLADIDGQGRYIQEPPIKRAESKIIDFTPALEHLADASEIDFSLEILRVVKAPTGRLGHPMVTKPLKNGQLALQMHQSKWLKNDTFSLYSNTKGYFLLKATQS